MKRSSPTWAIVLGFAIVHFAASLGLSLGMMTFLDSYEWVIRVAGWVMAVLTLPLLFALHDSSMSIAATVALIAANSAAAGLIFGLFVFAFRRGVTDTSTKALVGCWILAVVPSTASAENVVESTVGIPARNGVLL